MSFLVMGTAIAAGLSLLCGGLRASSKAKENIKDAQKMLGDASTKWDEIKKLLETEYNHLTVTANEYDELRNSFYETSIAFDTIYKTLTKQMDNYITSASDHDDHINCLEYHENIEPPEYNDTYEHADYIVNDDISEHADMINNYDQEEMIESAILDNTVAGTAIQIARMASDPKKGAKSVIRTGAGKAAGALATSGTMLAISQIGVASTGTAISTLSGAAATNATLAALGGGSIASGGLGMAVGGVVLGGVGFGAGVLAKGLFDLWRSSSEKEKAENVCKDKKAEIKEMKSQYNTLHELNATIQNYRSYIFNIYNIFIDAYNNITTKRTKPSWKFFNTEQRDSVRSCYLLESIIKDLFNEPIYTNSSGIIKIHQDSLRNAVKSSNDRLNNIESQIALMSSSDKLSELECNILTSLSIFSKIVEHIYCYPKLILRWFFRIKQPQTSISLLTIEYLKAFSILLRKGKLSTGVKSSNLIDAISTKNTYDELSSTINNYYDILNEIHEKYASTIQDIQILITKNRTGWRSYIKECFRFFQNRTKLKICYMLFCILHQLCHLRIFDVDNKKLTINHYQIDKTLSDAQMLSEFE